MEKQNDSQFEEQINSSSNDEGFAFGAVPELTSTLRRLVRAYPKDAGIIKEFIQNADDAGAKCVKIYMDWRSHPSEGLPSEKMKILMGPAILIFNDATFSDDDLVSIQNIGDSVKQVDTSKVGRFGLGFNATYNITDYPSLLTRNYILFFDPHTNVIPKANFEKPGRGWDLTKKYKGRKVWDIYRSMLVPYQVMDSKFVEGQEFFDGTLFRLPLRNKVMARKSKIKPEEFTYADFEFILDQLKQNGAELLLFLKNVTSISIYEIKPEQDEPSLILSIKTENEAEVQDKKAAVNQAIIGDTNAMLEKLRTGDANLPKASYTHSIRINYEGCEELQEWRIVSGVFLDDAGEILKATEEMIRQREKALSG